MEATSAAGIQDQFLNLLTTQLRHQDPLEPTKQEDFIAQLAQFSTLEGIEELNTNFTEFMSTQATANGDASRFSNMVDAARIVGNEVVYSADDSENGGIVESVVIQDNAVHVRINGKVIPLDDIQEIGTLTTPLTEPEI